MYIFVACLLQIKHMGSKIYLLLFLSFILVQPDCLADPISKAIKALQKGKHEQVESILNKSLQKYPINPGARYAYSLLFFDSTYVNGNLDSAHVYIEQALNDAQQPDSVEMLSLDKTSLTIENLRIHKSAVDRAAYSRAVATNSVEAFQYFIDYYASAPQLVNAISRRDILAFDIASHQDTYQSYRNFLDNYPDATMAPLARERYELLVFESKTADGKLNAYYQFLQEHPETPHREQAEWQIFQLETLDDSPESYRRFKNNLPKSKHVSTANDILYHLDKKAFVNQEILSDSLKAAYELESQSLIPIFENGRYGFMDRHGNSQITASVDSIPENYLCQLLTADVFQAYTDDQLVLMARNQKVLWDESFDSIEDLGQGLMKINNGTKYGILHKSGWLILEVAYDNIKMLGDSFLAIERDQKWGISSMTGKILVAPQLELIQAEGPFIVAKKGDWAVSNPERIIELYKQEKSLSFNYDDWEIFSQNYIMVFQGENEGILNRDLESVIPLSKHEIIELDSADWYVNTEHQTLRFYGDNLQTIPHDRYQKFVSNDHFIGLLRQPKWEIWDRNTLTRLNELEYDSVARLGTQLLILKDQESASILFRNGKSIPLDPSNRVKLIRDADQTLGFLQVNSNGGKREIYDMDGNQVYHTWYYDVSPLTSETFIIEKNGIQGIVNLDGKILLKPRYKTIVADSITHITLLHNGRFGFFNPQSGALIRPQYESRLIQFDHAMLSTTKSGKKGLVDHNNKVHLPFEYDDIRYWSDSLVVVMKEKQWAVLNYHSGEILYNDIKGIEWISGKQSQKAIIKTAEGYGLLDRNEGMVLNPGFNDIINLGTANEPVFFTEKYIPEADYYVVIYYNQDMQVIRKQVFDSGNYDQVYCF